MTPPDFTADLPAPRDDEPSSLRADIADELADHLACAVRREELVGWAVPTDECGNEHDRWAEPTVQRVLARFGDPRAVARKLWWDAMRERIMKERLLIGLTVVAVLACCGMAGLMWQMQAAQRDLLAESQAQNAKLIEQFQAVVGELRLAEAKTAPAEWVPLSVRCTFDTEDGAPVAGVKVDLRGDTERTLNIGGEQITDASGVVDFGKVLYARYDVSCRMPNGMYLRESVSVRPGQAKVVKIVCPSAPPPPAAVKFDIRPPEALRSKPLYYLAIVDSAWQMVGTATWRLPSREMDVPCYILGADGNVLGEVDAESSKSLRRLQYEQGQRLQNWNAEFLSLISDLKLAPVKDRHGFQMSGAITALIADDDPSVIETSRANGSLPRLRTIREASNPTETLSMNPDTRVMTVPDDGAQFWHSVAVLVELGSLRGGRSRRSPSGE